MSAAQSKVRLGDGQVTHAVHAMMAAARRLARHDADGDGAQADEDFVLHRRTDHAASALTQRDFRCASGICLSLLVWLPGEHNTTHVRSAARTAHVAAR